MSDANTPLSTPLTEISRLQALLNEIVASLNSQREVLKTRGINLPPMTMQVLKTVNDDLTKLEHSFVSEQTEAGQLRSLAENAAMINSALDLNDVLRRSMDVIISITGAERGYIIRASADNETLEFLTAVEDGGSAEHHTASGQARQVSFTVIREVLTTGTPLLTDNAFKDERLQANMSIAALTLRSVLCVPLQYKGSVIGVVYVDNRMRSGVFTPRELNLLAAFANQVAVALVNAQLFTEIQGALAEITHLKDITDNVFESIGSGIITTDSSNHVTTFNHAAALILERRDRDRVIHQRLNDLLHNDVLGDVIANVRDSGESMIVESELETASGRRIFASLKFNPLRDSDGQTQGVALVLDDLTEQQERSEMLRIMRRYLPPQMVDNIHTISGLDLGGEKRDVTCMFIDVRPLSTIPDKMRPQDVMEMVNGYLSTAAACIHDTNGVIDKYMGTEIMALFNTQLNPQENHALHAATAALLIRTRFAELYEQLGIHPNPHYYRIGVHSGIATLGNVGSFTRRDFTAIGDTINLAKRLEENATDGQIIISEETQQLILATVGTKAPCRFEEREPIKAKGRQQFTRVYEVFGL